MQHILYSYGSFKLIYIDTKFFEEEKITQKKIKIIGKQGLDNIRVLGYSSHSLIISVYLLLETKSSKCVDIYYEETMQPNF